MWTETRLFNEKEYSLSVLSGADGGFVVRLSGGLLENGATQVLVISKDDSDLYLQSFKKSTKTQESNSDINEAGSEAALQYQASSAKYLLSIAQLVLDAETSNSDIPVLHFPSSTSSSTSSETKNEDESSSSSSTSLLPSSPPPGPAGSPLLAQSPSSAIMSMSPDTVNSDESPSSRIAPDFQRQQQEGSITSDNEDLSSSPREGSATTSTSIEGDDNALTPTAAAEAAANQTTTTSEVGVGRDDSLPVAILTVRRITSPTSESGEQFADTTTSASTTATATTTTATENGNQPVHIDNMLTQHHEIHTLTSSTSDTAVSSERKHNDHDEDVVDHADDEEEEDDTRSHHHQQQQQQQHRPATSPSSSLSSSRSPRSHTSSPPRSPHDSASTPSSSRHNRSHSSPHEASASNANNNNTKGDMFFSSSSSSSSVNMSYLGGYIPPKSLGQLSLECVTEAARLLAEGAEDELANLLSCDAVIHMAMKRTGVEVAKLLPRAKESFRRDASDSIADLKLRQIQYDELRVRMLALVLEDKDEAQLALAQQQAEYAATVVEVRRTVMETLQQEEERMKKSRAVSLKIRQVFAREVAAKQAMRKQAEDAVAQLDKRLQKREELRKQQLAELAAKAAKKQATIDKINAMRKEQEMKDMDAAKKAFEEKEARRKAFLASGNHHHQLSSTIGAGTQQHANQQQQSDGSGDEGGGSGGGAAAGVAESGEGEGGSSSGSGTAQDETGAASSGNKNGSSESYSAKVARVKAQLEAERVRLRGLALEEEKRLQEAKNAKAAAAVKKKQEQYKEDTIRRDNAERIRREKEFKHAESEGRMARYLAKMAAMEEAQAALKRSRQENAKRDRIEWDTWKAAQVGLNPSATPGPRFFDDKTFDQLSSYKHSPSVNIREGKMPSANEMLEERVKLTPGPGLYIPPSSVNEAPAAFFSISKFKRLSEQVEADAKALPGVGDYDVTKLDVHPVLNAKISGSKALGFSDTVYMSYKGTPGPLTYAPVVGGVGLPQASMTASMIKASLLAGSRPSTASASSVIASAATAYSTNDMPSLMPAPPARPRPITAQSLRNPRNSSSSNGGGGRHEGDANQKGGRRKTDASGFDRASIEENKGIGTGMAFAASKLRSMLFSGGEMVRAPTSSTDDDDNNDADAERGVQSSSSSSSTSPSKKSPTKGGSGGGASENSNIIGADGRYTSDGSFSPKSVMSRLERAEMELQAAAEAVLAQMPPEAREMFLEKQARRSIAAAEAVAATAAALASPRKSSSSSGIHHNHHHGNGHYPTPPSSSHSAHRPPPAISAVKGSNSKRNINTSTIENTSDGLGGGDTAFEGNNSNSNSNSSRSGTTEMTGIALRVKFADDYNPESSEEEEGGENDDEEGNTENEDDDDSPAHPITSDAAVGPDEAFVPRTITVGGGGGEKKRQQQSGSGKPPLSASSSAKSAALAVAAAADTDAEQMLLAMRTAEALVAAEDAASRGDANAAAEAAALAEESAQKALLLSQKQAQVLFGGSSSTKKEESTATVVGDGGEEKAVRASTPTNPNETPAAGTGVGSNSSSSNTTNVSEPESLAAVTAIELASRARRISDAAVAASTSATPVPAIVPATPKAPVEVKEVVEVTDPAGSSAPSDSATIAPVIETVAS